MSGQIPVGPMNFNPMGTGQVSNPLANSIDSLFKAYELQKRSQLQDAQIPGIRAATQGQQIQNQTAQNSLAQNQADYQLQHFGLSPQDVSRLYPAASYAPPQAPQDGGPTSLYGTPTQANGYSPSTNQPSPVVPQAGQVPAIGGMPPMPGYGQVAPQGQPQQPQQAQPQGTDLSGFSPEDQQKIGALHGLIGMAGLNAQLGLANARASLAGKGAEANKNQAEANKSNILVNLLSGQGGGDAVKSIADRIVNGQEDPGLSELGRGEDQAALRLAVGLELNKRGTDVGSLQAAYDAKQEAAKAKAGSTAKVQGGDTQQIGTIAGVVEDTLDSAAPLVKSLNTNQIAAVNAGFLKGKKALNDPQSTALLTKLNILKNRYAVVSSYPNAPTKEQYDEASKLISDGLTSGSFSAMGDAMRQEGKSIVSRAGGKGFNQPNPNPAGRQLKIGRFIVEVH